MAKRQENKTGHVIWVRGMAYFIQCPQRSKTMEDRNSNDHNKWKRGQIIKDIWVTCNYEYEPSRKTHLT